MRQLAEAWGTLTHVAGMEDQQLHADSISRQLDMIPYVYT